MTEAHIGASLATLKQESKVAATLAEAKVLEAAAESELGEGISDVRDIPDHTHDYSRWTARRGNTAACTAAAGPRR